MRAAFSTTLGANVENLTLLGSGNFNATGNALSNTLTGNSGDNVLDGKAGADTLAGGAGNDTYFVDQPGDVITETGVGGTDLVISSGSYTLGANLENLTLTGRSAVNGTGNVGDNLLTGNAGNNALSGGDGNDTLIGGAGRDVLLGGTNDDRIFYDALDLSVQGGGGTDTLVLTGSDSLNLALIPDSRIQGIEVLDLDGDNTVVLNASDVLALSDDTGTLRIMGEAGDSAYSIGQGWVQGADQVIELDTYHTYTQGLATLLVDTNITQLIT